MQLARSAPLRSVAALAVALVSAMVLALALGGPATAQEGAGPLVVQCHDVARDIVQHKLASQCDGKVVTAAEAAVIKGRRIEAIRRALAPRQSVFPDQQLVGIGTGFFVAASGKVLTNNHVIAGCAAISVSTTTGEDVAATLIGADEDNDLAVLDTAIAAPATAAFRVAAESRPQEPIVLVGYPNQGIAPIKPLMASGVVLNRSQADETIFRIYADVRRGNSGGPVLDSHGLVVGVIFAKVDTVKVYEHTGDVIRHVGVAVKNAVVFDFLDQHAIAYSRTAVGRTLTDNEILTAARPYIARVGCWQ